MIVIRMMRDIENNVTEPLVEEEERNNRINQIHTQDNIMRMILLFSASASISIFIYMILTKN
jgi:hypothetical protein